MSDSERDERGADEGGRTVGPRDNTDDATKADMGMGGTPAESMTPAGQGDEPGHGTGAEPATEEQEGAERP